MFQHLLLNKYKIELFHQGLNVKHELYGVWFHWKTNTFDLPFIFPLVRRFKEYVIILTCLDIQTHFFLVIAGMISPTKVSIGNFPSTNKFSFNQSFISIRAADSWQSKDSKKCYSYW